METRAFESHHRWDRPLLSICLVVALTATGCIHRPQMEPLSRQKSIDRKWVEYPAGCRLVQLVKGLNCPTAICWDSDGDLIIAESGSDGFEPHIFGYRNDKNHTYFNIYPWKRDISFAPTGFVMYGPVGGMDYFQGHLYVSHRDHDGKGLVTALGFDGSHNTIVGDLPAQGDYGVTDVRVHNGRVYFGVGTATNSGVVGLDNFDRWLKRHPEVHDEVWSPGGSAGTPWKIQGYRFSSLNPWAGIFASDLVMITPFQPFGQSNESRIRPSDKPNGAVYSADVNGGPCTIEGSGYHNPRGLAFDKYGRKYLTNDGMELRGPRPVYDDPDTLSHISADAWGGWPDYTTNGHPISDPKYRPPISFLLPSGYQELSALVDQDASGLRLERFDVLVDGVFPSLSGAAKMDFIPETGPFKDLGGDVLVAEDGDRAPFATSGMKLLARQGFKVSLVDPGSKTVKDFIRNTSGVPVSMQPYGSVGLERPCDVKVGPDGAIYILDFGRMDNDSAIPRYYNGTGGLFKLESFEVKKDDATTRP